MRLSASVTFMFQELPLLARFEAARAAGFDGVEIQRLTDGDPREMGRAAREAGVRVVLVNVSSDDYASGGNGLSCVPGREQDFRAAFERALDVAAILGAARIHLGPSRVPEGVSCVECARVYRDNVRMALAVGSAAKPPLLIEAMNRVEAPTALLHDVDSAAAVVREIADDRLGLQFDIYHTAMNGDDPLASFIRHRSLVRHVQFADVPGRHEPGTGRLDIPTLLRALDRDGYSGWFGAEYSPSGTTLGSLGWLELLEPRSLV